MASASLVAAAFLIFNLIVLSQAATYIVGDAAGWTPDSDFKAWASTHHFVPGDVLVFNYDPLIHNVQQVSESDFATCNTGNSIKSYSTGSDSIIVNEDSYFVCATHCSLGMHLAIKMAETPIAPPTPITTPIYYPPPPPPHIVTPSAPITTTPTTPVTTTIYYPPPPPTVHYYHYNSGPHATVGVIFTTIFAFAPLLVL